MLRFTESDGTDHRWTVGQPRPLFGECTEVWANGEELVFIRNNFDNLPFPAGAKQVVWRGDFARFIHDNLDNLNE
jgi:hypothetical protein